MHVAQNKLIGIAKMVAIHLVFGFVNIIGKNNSPTGSFQSEPHKADARKKFTESLWGFCVHVSHRILASLTSALNTDLTRCATRFGSFNECSQIRKTRQPYSFNWHAVARSRIAFRVILRCQYRALSRGIRQCCLHPCQKHPSTNNASRSRRKTKSGLPRIF